MGRLCHKTYCESCAQKATRTALVKTTKFEFGTIIRIKKTRARSLKPSATTQSRKNTRYTSRRNKENRPAQVGFLYFAALSKSKLVPDWQRYSSWLPQTWRSWLARHFQACRPRRLARAVQVRARTRT